jgi:hypothetical protein
MVHQIVERRLIHVQLADPWGDHSLVLGRITSSLDDQTCLYRGSSNRYEDESPTRNVGRQQKPAGGGLGYGEYDYLYKNAPVCLMKLDGFFLYQMNIGRKWSCTSNAQICTLLCLWTKVWNTIH